MSCATLLVQIAVLGMPAAPVESADTNGLPQQKLEKLSVLQQNVTKELRREAIAKSTQKQEAAVRSLAALHRDLVADPRFVTSGTLKQSAMKIRARLRRVEKELSRSLRAQSPGELTGSQGGRAQQANNGQALVELIQTTISPASWDVNGGQSTIVYFAPRQVLVVRAPGEVHSRTRRLLRDLR